MRPCELESLDSVSGISDLSELSDPSDSDSSPKPPSPFELHKPHLHDISKGTISDGGEFHRLDSLEAVTLLPSEICMLPLPSESLPKPNVRHRVGPQPLSPPSQPLNNPVIGELSAATTTTVPKGGAISKDDKRRRNREAAVRFRKNKKLRDEKLNTELAELRQCQEDWRRREEDWRKREEDWKADKTRLQQSLAYYQKLFCQHNLQVNIARAGTTALSGLAMCIVVACVAMPDVSSNQHTVASAPPRLSGSSSSSSSSSTVEPSTNAMISWLSAVVVQWWGTPMVGGALLDGGIEATSDI